MYIRVEWTYAEQVLDPIKAAPEAALQMLRRCRYFSDNGSAEAVGPLRPQPLGLLRLEQSLGR